MKHELIVRPEPFSSPAEFDSYGSFETEAFGQWQGETRRDDPSDIRWVQDSLNRLMNLRLPLSGVMDAAARSALRSFQEKRSLTADGVLGPGTKRALAEAATYPGEEEAFPVTRLPARARAALTQGALGKKTPFRYVKDFAGPASECAAALKRAGKTRTEALSIINAQIGVAIVMLRKSATALKRGSRSDKTKTLFQKIFKVKPEFVPTWLKPTATIKDRGDVVATRCKRVAELLASGTIKFFCTINSTNCPDCSNDSSDFACSSWGDESKAPKNSMVVCLGDAFWDDMKAGKTDSLLATLTHEPFHIYYGKYVTEHRSDAGKFGGINCIVQFVFETNGRAAPDRVHERCTNMVVRKETGGFLSFRPEPWPTESEWEGEASRTGPDYIRWVQSSLNRVMGLRLAVDGIMGPATRSAVRSFQQRKGLAVDGIVGPNTEGALIAAGAPRPPVAAVSATATGGGSPSTTTLPPECSGVGSANCVVLYDFAPGGYTLTAIHQEQIAGIARRVISSQETSAPIKLLTIVGHASPEGTYDYNMYLASQRAEEVEEALVVSMDSIKRGSSSPSRIELDVKSCGEAKIPGESDPAKQRRVDVCFPWELRAVPCDPTPPIPIRKPVLRDPIRAPSPSGPIPLEQLERITTSIPWPRGLVFVDSWLVVLARGGVGQIGPVENDLAGHLFGVDVGIAQPYSKDVLNEVKNNACRLTGPAGSTSYGSRPVRPNAPFRLWNPNKKEDDIDTDRPYAGLAYDPRSQSLFVACFSGIDVPDQGKNPCNGRTFKKNATDAIHRFHVPSRTWHRFEAHDPTDVPNEERRKGNTGMPCPPDQLKCRTSLPNQFYATRAQNTPPPHGWLNGPDGLCVFGNWLYAVAKDNHVLVRYDLTEIRRNPQTAGPPRGILLFQGDHNSDFDSPSAVNVQGEYLYVGIRANNKNAVLRFRLGPDGDLRRPGPGVSPKAEVVARFPGEPLPEDPKCTIEPEVTDIAFNHRGELFVSGAKTVWRVGIPTGSGKVLMKKDAYIAKLPKSSNIAFDQEDRLYICCNSKDDPDPTALPGVIYRAPNLT